MHGLPIFSFFKKTAKFWNMSLSFWINIFIHFRLDISDPTVQIIPTFFIIVRITWPTAWWVSAYVKNAFEPVRYLIDSTFLWVLFFLFVTFDWFSCWFLLYNSFLFLLAIYHCSFYNFIWKLWIIAPTFFRFLEEIIVQVFIVLEFISLLLFCFEQSKTPDLILRVVSCDGQILHRLFLIIK